MVGTYLIDQGYDVRCLCDVKQLEARLECQRPDLLVLDVMLPGDDGLTALRRLRDAGDDLPVVMLTARREIWARARKAGPPPIAASTKARGHGGDSQPRGPPRPRSRGCSKRAAGFLPGCRPRPPAPPRAAPASSTGSRPCAGNNRSGTRPAPAPPTQSRKTRQAGPNSCGPCSRRRKSTAGARSNKCASTRPHPPWRALGSLAHPGAQAGRQAGRQASGVNSQGGDGRTDGREAEAQTSTAVTSLEKQNSG